MCDKKLRTMPEQAYISKEPRLQTEHYPVYMYLKHTNRYTLKSFLIKNVYWVSWNSSKEIWRLKGLAVMRWTHYKTSMFNSVFLKCWSLLAIFSFNMENSLNFDSMPDWECANYTHSPWKWPCDSCILFRSVWAAVTTSSSFMQMLLREENCDPDRSWGWGSRRGWERAVSQEALPWEPHDGAAATEKPFLNCLHAWCSWVDPQSSHLLPQLWVGVEGFVFADNVHSPSW